MIDNQILSKNFQNENPLFALPVLIHNHNPDAQNFPYSISNEKLMDLWMRRLLTLLINLLKSWKHRSYCELVLKTEFQEKKTFLDIFIDVIEYFAKHSLGHFSYSHLIIETTLRAFYSSASIITETLGEITAETKRLQNEAAKVKSTQKKEKEKTEIPSMEISSKEEETEEKKLDSKLLIEKREELLSLSPEISIHQLIRLLDYICSPDGNGISNHLYQNFVQTLDQLTCIEKGSISEKFQLVVFEKIRNQANLTKKYFSNSQIITHKNF